MKNNNVRKAGISLVALVITIIVLIVLTGAVVMTGVNAPSNAQLAVFKSNVATVQDAVTIKMLNNMLEYKELNSENAKWIGVAEGYAEADVANDPAFGEEINGVAVVKLDSSLKESLAITDEEFGKYYVDTNGIVYHEGYTYNGVIYYNANVSNKAVESIEITSVPSKIEYTEWEKFNPSGIVVTATYSDGSTADVTSSVTYTPTLDTELSTTNTSITVTYQGKTAIVNITVEEAITLGSLITGPSMYGTTVTGYNGNGIESWQVLYKQTIGTEEYVYIIPTTSTANTALTSYSGSNASSIISNAKTYFGLSNDFDTVGTSNSNYLATLWLLDTSEWEAYKDSSFGDKVVGVIGSPTMEMVVASYNDKNAETEGFTNLSYTVNSKGYSDPGDFSGEFYQKKYWLASPSSINANFVWFMNIGGLNYDFGSNACSGLCPVVCLKSNILATVTDDGIDIY